MTNKLRIAMCQLNPTTGDFVGNFEIAKNAIQNNPDADLYVFSECFVGNYPADDLHSNPDFLHQTQSALLKYAELSKEHQIGILVGYSDGNFNSAVLINNGQFVQKTTKSYLPRYGVFDDARWFERGDMEVMYFRGFTIHPLICEDLWSGHDYLRFEDDEIYIVLNSSPYGIKKYDLRKKIAGNVIKHNYNPIHTLIVYVNHIGGNDEIVWDGGSFATDGTNEVLAPQWVEGVYVVEIEKQGDNFVITNPHNLRTEYSFAAERYIAATMGLRDYINKVGFTDIVFGNSGGADSCLVALMTADAIGAEHCLHVRMPSQFTSDDSNDLGKSLTDGIGATGLSISIADQYNTTIRSIANAGVMISDLAKENLQAQLRGDILSAISNTQRRMIISTGNKSEAAMGYATLYGDMRGGYNPLKDLYKHKDVYELLRWRIEQNGNLDLVEIFPNWMVTISDQAINAVRGIIDRPPSAELAPGQKDTDSLPDYAVLDDILWHYIDGDEQYTVDEVATLTGNPREMVADIINRMHRAEFKRNQACPGPKIHRNSFAKKDWRYPVASRFRV